MFFSDAGTPLEPRPARISARSADGSPTADPAARPRSRAGRRAAARPFRPRASAGPTVGRPGRAGEGLRPRDPARASAIPSGTPRPPGRGSVSVRIATSPPRGRRPGPAGVDQGEVRPALQQLVRQGGAFRGASSHVDRRAATTDPERPSDPGRHAVGVVAHRDVERAPELRLRHPLAHLAPSRAGNS